MLPIVAILLSAAPASAQVSIWLKRGVSGFGVSTGVSKGEDTFTLGAGLGYSYQAWLDFDLNFQRTTFDEGALEEIDAAAYGIAPGVQFHPLKQSKTMPISLALSATFTKTWLTSDAFEGESGGGTTGVIGGVSIYRFFRLGERVGIIPAASLNLNYIKASLTDFDGNELIEDQTDTIVSVGLGAYLAYLDEGGRVWGLVPQVTITDDGAEFGLVLALVFSQGPKDDAPDPPDPTPPPAAATTPPQ
jgi:hypothetical protein